MSEFIEVPNPVLEQKGMGSEASWSEHLPAIGGADAPVQPEFNRDQAIRAAIAERKEGRRVRPEVIDLPGIPAQAGVHTFPGKPTKYHFFVLDGKKMTFIGSKEMDVSRFQKDVSGRFFREWLKKEFPGRKDYDKIVSFDDKTTLKEITDLLGMVE